MEVEFTLFEGSLLMGDSNRLEPGLLPEGASLASLMSVPRIWLVGSSICFVRAEKFPQANSEELEKEL